MAMRKSQRWMLMFILCAGTSACRAADPSATGAVAPYTIGPDDVETAAPSNDITNSTNVLTPSFSPSSTPWPDLHTAGPYLFLNNTAYEPDGSGMRQFDLPEGYPGYKRNFSPDRRWFAYTNTADSDNAPPDKRTLRIYNLFTGEDRLVAPLAPEDYEERQEKMTDEIIPEYINHGYNPEDDDVDVFWAIGQLNFRQVWSPDGRYLAFAAIIDGNSSDVYVYDVDTGNLQRKDTDILNVGTIGWSSDGRWIIYNNWLPGRQFAVFMGDNWCPTPTRLVRSGPSSEHHSIPHVIEDWLSPHELLLRPYYYQDGGDAGGQDLILFNLNTGSLKTVWKGWWNSYAVDPTKKTILLSVQEPCDSTDCLIPDSSGLYYGSWYGSLTRIADGFFSI